MGYGSSISKETARVAFSIMLPSIAVYALLAYVGVGNGLLSEIISRLDNWFPKNNAKYLNMGLLVISEIIGALIYVFGCIVYAVCKRIIK